MGRPDLALDRTARPSARKLPLLGAGRVGGGEGGDVESNRALISVVPADPVALHEDAVSADAQRPPQPTNRDPAFGVAVRLT